MTLEQQMQAAKDRTLKTLETSTEFNLREAQVDLQVYYADEMNSATTSNNVRTKLGKLRALRNDTNQLYILYGNLVRSLQPKQRGNIAEISRSLTNPFIKLGIDLSVIPYARIHEFGGTAGRAKIPARPYFFPALQKYAKEGFEERLQAIVNACITTWNAA